MADQGSLRSALTDRLVRQGAIHDERVEAAFRAVPRHVFVPSVPLEVAYTDDVVLMKRDDAGVAISSVSQPTVVAMMLEQADVRPGHRVLEIGSGGYNAALLQELVGPDGSVTTVDIDADVVERAREGLAEAGYPQVRVVWTDGEFGSPESAPYDRILVTVTAWDIAPAWIGQLSADGRIVVPLRLRGQTRAIAFDLVDGFLRSRSMTLCGFVNMQGAGANLERLLPIQGSKVRLSIDEDQNIEADALAGVLRTPRARAWSAVLMNRQEPLSDLDLWLASTLPGYCVLTAGRSAQKKGRVAPTPRWGASAIVAGGTLAYLTSRAATDPELVELGAIGHGPDAAALVDRLVAQLQFWHHHHRHTAGPTFTVHPATTPAEALPAGCHITKRHTRITITWP